MHHWSDHVFEMRGYFEGGLTVMDGAVRDFSGIVHGYVTYGVKSARADAVNLHIDVTACGSEVSRTWRYFEEERMVTCLMCLGFRAEGVPILWR